MIIVPNFSKLSHSSFTSNLGFNLIKSGYNVQIGVEAEYIVDLDISSERSDQLTLILFLNNIKLKPAGIKTRTAKSGIPV